MADSAGNAGRALPRPAVLREITDAAVLAEVFRRGRVTRAVLAQVTGISMPTVWESVRRLAGAGLLRAAGSQETSGRGRASTFYELAETAGWVLGLAVDQQGIRTAAADLAGRPIGDAPGPRAGEDGGPSLTGAIGRLLRLAREAHAGRGPLRAVGLSVASPVRPGAADDPGDSGASGGRVIALPASPFPEGNSLSAAALAAEARAPVLMDNDVSLAALAERRAGRARDAASFAFAYIGGGLGMAVYLGDQLIRGAHGLAGEIGYLAAPGPDGRTVTLDEALARRGWRRPGAAAIDVPAVLDALARAESGDPAATTAVAELAASIGQAVVAACAVVDPELVLLGGPIGSQPALLEPVRATVGRFSPAPPRIEPGGAGESAPLQGALHLALDHGRRRLT